jgi:hypothetical protein
MTMLDMSRPAFRGAGGDLLPDPSHVQVSGGK